MAHSTEFIDAVAEHTARHLSGQGFAMYATSGVSVQLGTRRAIEGAAAIAVFTAAGGAAFPRNQKEQYGFVVNVDAKTREDSLNTSRLIFDELHDTIAMVISGSAATFEVLWLRSTSGPPQELGNGPGDEQRWLSTVNYDALLVKD